MARIPVNGGFDNISPWWNSDERKHSNYYLRFKVVFPNDEKGRQMFLDLWPTPMINVAEDSWDILSTLYADLFLNAKTATKCIGLVKRAILKFKGQFKRLSEINNISLGDWFSNDIIKTIQRDSTNTASETTNSNSDDTTNGTSQDFDNNNNATKDEMGNIIDWTAPKYANGTNTTNRTDTSTANASSNTTQNGHGNETNESKSTQYNSKAALILLTMSEDPTSRLFKGLVRYIAAPVQFDPETLIDWQGNYGDELN